MQLKVFIGCLLAPFFIGCSNTDQQNEAVENNTITNNYPNQDSELTLLMRKLYDDADTIKQHINAGRGTITDDFIEELELAHSVTPSDPKLSNPTFKAFNDLIVNEAKSLQLSSDNRVERFNNLINRCIDCHKTFCPGPIPRIKKLKITGTQ